MKMLRLYCLNLCLPPTYRLKVWAVRLDQIAFTAAAFGF